METPTTPETDAATRKQNQDFPNIPASAEKPKSDPETFKKEVKEASKNHETGKTENTEKH